MKLLDISDEVMLKLTDVRLYEKLTYTRMIISEEGRFIGLQGDRNNMTFIGLTTEDFYRGNDGMDDVRSYGWDTELGNIIGISTWDRTVRVGGKYQKLYVVAVTSPNRQFMTRNFYSREKREEFLNQTQPFTDSLSFFG